MDHWIIKFVIALARPSAVWASLIGLFYGAFHTLDAATIAGFTTVITTLGISRTVEKVTDTEDNR